jgi:hypothetical protein
MKIDRFFTIQLETSNFLPDNSVPFSEYKNYYINNIIDLSSLECLILTILMEEYPQSKIVKINEAIKVIKEIYSNLKIIVFVGSQYLRKDYIKNNSVVVENDYVYYVNPFWYTLYYQIIKNKMCKISKKYSKNCKKDFLLLIGKPDREHRLEILYRLYKKDLLKNANWKFFIHNSLVKDNCRKILKDLSTQEFENFVNSVNKKLDKVEIAYFDDSSHYSGIPFDYKIFDKSKFQIICETNFYSSIISEKTYISILNKRPFIMVSQPSHNLQLRQYGFKTFEEYCLIKDYQENTDSADHRYDLVIQNIEFWINNIDKFYKDIKNDVEHNFNLFIKLAQFEERKIKKIIKKHNLDAEPSDIVKGYYIK